ncbi:MAG TPA: histidinol-phosphate transaminase [Thermoleophilaceae bacterium]|nr:histidinol-phosphate transaminase [Thermoleophilaceae bacterium]
MSGIEFNDRVGRIPVYPAAKTWEHEGELVELASNEAPWGPLPAVVGALNGQIERLNRYPDPGKTLLRQRIADRCELPAARVAVGNGSCELLMSAAEVLLEPGAELIYAWPSFSIYPHIAAQSGARAIEVPLDDEQRHDLDAMAAEVTAATRLVLICNPNNPTGTALPVEAIDAFMTGLPRHIAVILDEAYVEFNALQDPGDSLDLVGRHPNLIVLRTFSKVYGLCGLRAGYALGPEEFRLAVDRVRQPFSVNALAQAAAAEAIRHQDEVTRRVEATIVERAWLEVELEDRGLTTTDSQANFVWVDLGEREEAPIVDGLAKRGVIIRSGAALGSEGHLRVTLGTRKQNERFVTALDELL